MRKFLCIFILTSLIYSGTWAQEENTIQDILKSTESSFFKAKLSYLSNNVFNGRKDSLPVPYVTPLLQYINKTGIYAKTSISYLASSYAQRIDLFDIEAGYMFEINDHLSGGISADKPFYNSASISVKSETKAEFYADFSWDINKILSISSSFGYMLTSGKADKFIGLGLAHEFTIGEDEQWSIEPSFTVNFGTRNYYDRYKSSRALKTGKTKKAADSTVTNIVNGKVITTTTITTLNANVLNMLDNEFSLPIYRYAGKWTFFALPTFAIPLNPAEYKTVVLTNRKLNNGTSTKTTKTTLSTEKISNSFYLEVGLSYRF